MITATIEGDKAIIKIDVVIPKQYYEFFQFLQEAHGFSDERLSLMAQQGIILDINTTHGGLVCALEAPGVDVKTDLSINVAVTGNAGERD